MDHPFDQHDDLRSKFEDFEYTPDEALWDRIAAGAGEADAPGNLAETFVGYTHAPHPRVWRGLADQLAPGRKRRRAIVWWSTAAGIALLLGFFLWQGTNSPGFQSTNLVADATPDSSNQPSRRDQNPTSSPKNPRIQAETAAGMTGDSTSRPSQVPANTPGPNLAGGSRHRQPQPGQSADRSLLADRENQSAHPGEHHLPILQTLGRDHLTRQEPRPKRSAFAFAARPDLDPEPLEVTEDFEFPDEKNGESQLFAGLGTGSSPLAPGTGTYRNSAWLYAPQELTAEQNAFQLSSDVSQQGYRESFQPPFSLAAQVGKPLSGRWTGVLGLVYTHMRSETEILGGEWRFVNETQRNYLGLSLAGQYAFLKRKRFSLFAAPGLQYDFGVGGRRIDRDYLEGILVNNSRRRSTSGRQAALKANLGANFHLLPRLDLNLQSGGTTWFYQTNYNLWSERVIWPSFQVGLTLGL